MITRNYIIPILTERIIAESFGEYILRSARTNTSFAEDANINLLLTYSHDRIRRKLKDLERIFSFLANISSTNDVSFAVIKMQPIITHVGNDIDVLVPVCKVKEFLATLKKAFMIKAVETHERTSKGFKATIHIHDIGLNQIEIYTYIGWYGYTFMELHPLENFYASATFVLGDKNIPGLAVIREPYSTYIDILHAVFGNRYITLSDVLKFILRFRWDYMKSFNELLDEDTPLVVRYAVKTFMKALKSCLRELFARGRCFIPEHYMISFSFLSTANNIFKKESLPDIATYWEVYWREFRRILSTIYNKRFSTAVKLQP